MRTYAVALLLGLIVGLTAASTSLGSANQHAAVILAQAGLPGQGGGLNPSSASNPYGAMRSSMIGDIFSSITTMVVNIITGYGGSQDGSLIRDDDGDGVLDSVGNTYSQAGYGSGSTISSNPSMPAGTLPPVEANESAPRTLDSEPEPYPTIPIDARTGQEPVPLDVSLKKLEDLGDYVNRFREESDALRDEVQVIFTPTVDQALQAAIDETLRSSLSSGTPEQVRTFDPDAREHLVALVRQKVAQRQATLSTEIRDAAVTAPPEKRASQIQSVLRSSLDDIALLIEAEVGVDVHVALDERQISTQIRARTESVGDAGEPLLVRDGLDLYEDRDNDSVSDYDEKHIYGTNPYDAHTAGSLLTDGERILLGYDAHSKSTREIPVESPLVSGTEVQNLYEVDRIEVIPSGTSTPRTVFTGRGLPNGFITLYIFSTPIVVTIKADYEGRWQYELDKELPDGEHQLFLATVDNVGRIVAKSPSVLFVKTAEAAEFTPLSIQPFTRSEVAPVDALTDNLLLLVGFAILVFLLLALVMLGMLGRRPRPQEPGQTPV